jgi:2-dehydropantoate 2-reductase
MQRTQVEAVLPILSQNKSKNIAFVVNTASGYEDWAKAVGEERLIIGFPSAGGVRANGEVYYFIGRGLIRTFQTTTFSNLYGTKATNVEEIIKVFNQSGIPTVFCSNMDAWQKTHVAVVTSIANALYKYSCDNYKLSKSYSDIKLMLSGIKEGFLVLNSLGIKITPMKLNYFRLPLFLIAPIFKMVMGTKLAEITMAKHTTVAESEMVYLQEEFDNLIKTMSE